MRFKFEFELKNPEIPLDYRKLFVSFFKNALTNYSESEIKKYYNNDDPIIKAFSFAVFFERPKFSRDKIELGNNKLILNYTTPCYDTGINYYNALAKMLNKPYSVSNKNTITLKNINMIKESVVLSDELNVRIMSPIVVRLHQKDKNLDKYLMPMDEDYNVFLKRQIESSLKVSGSDEILEDLDLFSVVDYSNTKAVKVLFYGHKITGIVGSIKIKGTSRLLDFIIKSGLGSRTSAGFGMVERGDADVRN